MLQIEREIAEIVPKGRRIAFCPNKGFIFNCFIKRMLHEWHSFQCCPTDGLDQNRRKEKKEGERDLARMNIGSERRGSEDFCMLQMMHAERKMCRLTHTRSSYYPATPPSSLPPQIDRHGPTCATSKASVATSQASKGEGSGGL
jgi:hypothetical protein